MRNSAKELVRGNKKTGRQGVRPLTACLFALAPAADAHPVSRTPNCVLFPLLPRSHEPGQSLLYRSVNGLRPDFPPP